MSTTLPSTMGRWLKLGMAAVLAIAISGCGGGGGGGSPDTGSGPSTPPPPVQPPGASVTVPPPTGTPIDAATLTADQWSQLAPKGAITSVTTDGNPVVTFQVTDANNRGIKGLGFTNKASTAKYASYSNLSFTLAKLVPGSDGAPSKWVSYIVITPATTTAADTPTRPTSDNKGTLVDNGDGTYKYTFWTNISTVKSFVDSQTYAAPNKAADLGDLTYDTSKLHRIAIQVSGNARGTGTNTADGSNSGVTAVPMAAPANLILDWWPATHKVVPPEGEAAGRDIVTSASCYECHGSFTFHGGSRQDTKYCDTCHTDQRKYGRTEAATTATGYSGSTYLVMGRTVGNLPNEIHKIHMGERLTKTGYNYGGVLFKDVTYPQPIQNCTKCHDGSAGAKHKTAQGDNWKNVPSRLACGACHDGIDFSTGKGLTLADAEQGLATSQYGHIGGAQADDSKCALCHSAAAIPLYHVTVDNLGANGRGGYPLNTANNVPTAGFPSGQGPSIPLAAQMNLPAGVYKINYEIKQVTVSGAAGAKKATVVYRVLKDGQPVTFNATGNLITNVDGSPGVYVVYAVPQDGIASPADWNAQKSASIKALRDGTNGNTQTGPDANGFYTATLGAVIPDNAAMVTGVIGVDYNGFVQLNLADYPKGIRLREPNFVMKVADGNTARRSIVDNDKCNACHAQLGVAPSFHSGARNNGSGCALGGCHDANKNTGHTGAPDFGGGWSVASKSLIHGIHGASKRDQPFTYEATADNPNGFQVVTYPGILKNCETCHVSGSYDFSAAANAAALPNLLWSTDAKTDMTNAGNVKPLGQSPWVTTLGRGQVDYSKDNLVSSPIASSCFGCHDNSLAVQHMMSNGGTLVSSFSTVASVATRPAIGAASTMKFTKTEQCMLCHAPGKVADIRVMHAK